MQICFVLSQGCNSHCSPLHLHILWPHRIWLQQVHAYYVEVVWSTLLQHKNGPLSNDSYFLYTYFHSWSKDADIFLSHSNCSHNITKHCSLFRFLKSKRVKFTFYIFSYLHLIQPTQKTVSGSPAYLILFCMFLCSWQGCQWRPVVSTQPAVNASDREIPTVAGVSCTTCEYYWSCYRCAHTPIQTYVHLCFSYSLSFFRHKNTFFTHSFTKLQTVLGVQCLDW